MENLQVLLNETSITALLSGAVMAIGVLAFLVSAITQVTKGLGALDKIPTNIQVTVLSLILTVIAYFAYNTYATRSAIWYEVVAVIIMGFIVSFVATYGWEKLHELWTRFKNTDTTTKSEDKTDIK